MSRADLAVEKIIKASKGIPRAEPWRRARETAEHFAWSRPTLLRLVAEEGLPARDANDGHGRRLLTFRWSEVDLWLDGRRVRQVQATLEGRRFARRAGA